MDLHANAIFLWEAAQCGSNLVGPLTLFGKTSSKVDSIASKISLSSSHFLEASKQVNQNSKFFNDSFPEKLKKVTLQCIKEFDCVRDALSTIASYEKDPNSIPEEVAVNKFTFRRIAPRIHWKKILWAMQMDMSDSGFRELEDRLEDCVEIAWGIQSLVSLVCIQKFAQERELDNAESAHLLFLKKRMRLLLSFLRRSEIASLMAYKLSDDTEQAVNVAQLARGNLENDIADDASSTVTACTIVDSISSLKKESASVPPPPPPPPFVDKPIYEIYRASEILGPTKAYNTTFKLPLLNIPFSISRKQWENRYYLNKVPATQEELKTYMAANITNEVPGIKGLLGMPPIGSSQLYQMIETKNNSLPTFPKREWTVKSITPINNAPKHSKWSIRQKKAAQSDGFIIIIKGVEVQPWAMRRYAGTPPPPPPPPNWKPKWKPNRSRTRSKPRLQKKISRDPVLPTGGTGIELTREEVEGVVNDFLATVSTLYDGIPVEERCKALRELEIDDDSDASSFVSTSSMSTSSIVDD